MRAYASLARIMAALCLAAAGAAPAEPWKAPHHQSPWPGLTSGTDRDAIAASLDLGPDLERGRSPAAELAEHRRLSAALEALQPQRRGVVDAYVISIALDSDPVFGREARECWARSGGGGGGPPPAATMPPAALWSSPAATAPGRAPCPAAASTLFP